MSSKKVLVGGCGEGGRTKAAKVDRVGYEAAKGNGREIGPQKKIKSNFLNIFPEK